MRIFLNGEERELPSPQTVSTLLQATGHADKRIAVEVNLEIIPRGRHDGHALADGDRVELIQAIGGG